MIKTGLSWSNIENKENFLGKKRVDLSIFKYGVHIPHSSDNIKVDH